MNKIVEHYLKEPETFVFPFEIHQKNNKVRTIITYLNDSFGDALRKYHEYVLNDLNFIYKNNKYSYAYRKKTSCRHALLDHLKSNVFIKLDIHSFFESISLDNFMKEGAPLIDNMLSNEEIASLFYGENLSLGYVTSPIVSDIYMNSFDIAVEQYLSSKPLIHYSRYCDDILISSEENDFAELEALESFIEKQLIQKGLELNKKKEAKAYLDFESHNSFSFLGLNISKNEDGTNKITVSKHFILKILDLLDVYYKNPKKCNYIFQGMILSRIAYLKQNSQESYQRFLKKHKNKFNKPYRGL